MTEEAVLTSQRDGVLVVTLNRPNMRNAINEELSLGVAEAMARLDQSDALRVAVLHGAGGTFCAGMDLRAFSARPPEEAAAALARLVRHSTRKPLVAAIDGFAVGGGLELALACDLMVATPDARLGIPEVARGLVPSGGALLRLPHRLPYNVALDMALTGQPISGIRAHELGLVSRLADPGDPLGMGLAVAASIAAAGQLAVNGSKTIMSRRIDDAESAEAWEAQFAVTLDTNASEDAHEGIRAFLEKRAPVFRGR
ncbi:MULTISPECIES: crotonase/enoyl-CoA hydratase family protein [unclassified Nocardioides]|uniref:crotonase/enoyl-CoA hydratase family protein n=1 Tax=unclassified Nocardioides TaxID=2615069 RepID=UPI00005717DC|nr:MULTISPECIES: crotonase/enoyl-CoA hydratase family protein [unclassified Nocardioides]ABL80336.1 short chain enoyl-CoA hydratase [Nocardioides sp. JS614]